MRPANDVATFDGFVTESGRAPAIWSLWSEWGNAANRAFPTGPLMDALLANGTVPMIYWDPVDPAHLNDPKYRYREIVDRKFDTYIRNWAKAAKLWGGRVLLQFAHEMNGNWYPWGVGRFDNTPSRFKKAWRHIWNVFHNPNVGATNVAFLWSPFAPCGQCAPYETIYPGDQYVDYVGFTGFNWGKQRTWRSMAEAFKPSVNRLRKVTHRPIVAAETGSAVAGGQKDVWVHDGYREVYQKYPDIVAIVYFNIDMRSVGHPDWSLTNPLAAMDEYKVILTRPRFQGVIP